MGENDEDSVFTDAVFTPPRKEPMETINTTPKQKSCSFHKQALWKSLTPNEHNGYIKSSGRYFGRKCSCCRLKFTTGKSSEGLTTWKIDKPGRVCPQCKNFLVCHSCFVSWLVQEGDIASSSKSRTRRHA
jgi:hypothetical protein